MHAAPLHNQTIVFSSAQVAGCHDYEGLDWRREPWRMYFVSQQNNDYKILHWRFFLHSMIACDAMAFSLLYNHANNAKNNNNTIR